MNQNINFIFIAVAIILSVSSCMESKNNYLEGRVVCIDPGHGGTAETDSFRVGPSGEREEWINLRVALKLSELLEENGAIPVLTRTADSSIGLKERADLARSSRADAFISIHHNATADSSVNFPIVYYHGNSTENPASVILGELVAQNIRAKLYQADHPASLVSDHVIFPGGGTAVLRHSYGIPGVIGEASFFTNPDEEARLKEEEYNQKEAEAYLEALNYFFWNPKINSSEKYSSIKLPRFDVFQEAERMNPVALLWEKDYEDGMRLSLSDNNDSLETALRLLSRSVKSFPDSWLARDAHIKRGEILQKLGRKEDAKTAWLRVREFYKNVSEVQLKFPD